MSADEIKLVPAVEKTRRILDYVAANRSATFRQIYSDLGLPKSSTHSLLATLEHLQFLRQTGDGEYSLGLKLFELGTLAANAIDLRAEARPLLKRLAARVQLTSHLGILQGNEGIYLLKEEIEHILKITSWEGKAIRLLSSGLGKILLAWQPESFLDQLLIPAKMVPRTSHTISTPEAMRSELDKVRQRGWAIDNEEDGYGVRCVAGPVRGLGGQVIGAVSVTGTVHQIPDERIEALAVEVVATCREISTKMGYAALS